MVEVPRVRGLGEAMVISEVVAALEAIRLQRGDVDVFHYDDWDFFLVEKVEFEPACGGKDPIENLPYPAHVQLSSGDRPKWYGYDGKLQEV